MQIYGPRSQFPQYIWRYQVTIEKTLPRSRPFRNTMPPDGYCRFPYCKQAGLYFKRLDKHLKRCHAGKTKEDNFNRPPQNPVSRSSVKNTDRQRKPYLVPGCSYYGVPISRLERHVKKVHCRKDPGNRKSVVECSFSEDEESNDCFSAQIARIIDNL